MKSVPVTMRHVKASKRALVDDEDYEKVMLYHWYEKDTGYAISETGSTRKNKVRTLMHHLVFGKPPQGMVTDHINGNPFDNRKSNLRFCTHAENARNLAVAKDNKTGYKGVCFDSRPSKRKSPWRARIKFNYKQIELGCYSTPELAHEAYQKAAKQYFGEFVREVNANV